MAFEVDINSDSSFSEVLLRYGDRIETKEGNLYLRIPFWGEMSPDGKVTLHGIFPEDLSKFITKHKLGGDNPRIIEAKL